MPCEQAPVPASLIDALRRRDGDGIFVRPVHASDAGRVADFVRTLTPASRYLRFHIGLHELPPAMIEHFVRNSDGGLALVAAVCDEGREVVVAEGRHAAVDEEGATHEFALVVHEDFRRTGLGEHLLRRLMRHAADHGVQRLIGDVLHGNRAMLALAVKLGFTVLRHPDDIRLQRVEHVLGVSAADAAFPHLHRAAGLRGVASRAA
jgi:acetyltransferase